MKKEFQFFNQCLAVFYDEAKADGPVEVTVYDAIGKNPWTGRGMSAEDFRNALKELVPNRDRDLNLLINSKGGDVHEGLAIRNELESYPRAITGTITGIAASTASWLLPKKAKVRAYKNSQVFIHDAIGLAMGPEDKVRKLADDLGKTSNQIAQMYADKTGKGVRTMRAMMQDSTLMTGTEAKSLGIVDELIDGEAVKNFSSEEVTEMRNFISAIYNTTAAGDSRGQTKTKTVMNKEQIIALLKEHGVTVANDATDEQLQAALKELLAAKKTSNADNRQDNPEIALLKKQIEQLTEANNTQKKQRITNQIDALVNNDQLTAELREEAIRDCMRDETRLDGFYRKLPAKPPGAKPVGVVVEKNAEPKVLLNAFNQFSEATRSWQRGNDIAPVILSQNAVARSLFFRDNRDRLTGFMNVGTNTVPAGLKRNVILQDVITDFARKVIPLQDFATNFGTVPLEGTNKVEVRYYDLDAGASSSWVAATGYAAGDTTTAVKEIQIGSNGGNAALLCDRKFQGLSFTSEELRRQPYLDIVRLARLKADKLGSDIVTHVLNVITAANYGAAALTVAAAAIDVGDISDLKLACKLWPEMSRSLWLDSAYDAELLKREGIRQAMQYGGSEAIREGKIPKLFGFNYRENPTIPTNSENLVGFAAFASAILYAQAPVPPAEEVRNAGTTYEVFADAASGVSMEYRTFGDNTLDTAKHFIEASYGFAVGNATAIKRITSA